MAPSPKDASSDKPRRPPATTPEARENQLVALAFDMAEEQLSNGTASAQVLTHYLKIGSTREQHEVEMLRKKNIVLEAQANAMESTKRIEALYTDAMAAFRSYQGEEPGQDDNRD